MRTVFLALVFLVTAGGLVAKPLTFTFEEYQVDPTTYEVGKPYPIERLAGLTPLVRQLVELSAEGYGKASATINGSTVSVDVHAASLKEFRFEFAVKHAFISAYADEVPIITTRGTKTKLALKMGEPFVVGALLEGSKGEADQQAYVMVVKLTD